MKKVILENRPFEFANAQYNFDNALGLLGSPPDTNIIDKTLEIFTTVENKLINIDSTHPDFVSGGVMWNYKGSSINFLEIESSGEDVETDGGKYINVKFAIYMYDESGDNPSVFPVPSEISGDDGEYIRDNIVNEGNAFYNNGVRIGYWSKGNQSENSDEPTLYNLANGKIFDGLFLVILTSVI